jgi:two-component system chemotaxis sensor kinase CheA
VSDPDADLTELFRDESAQRLDQMDTALLAVESGAAGAETIDSLFRNAHTIKGAAGMLGFDDVRVLAHATEDVLATVRAAGVFPPEFAAPLLRATASLRAQVNAGGTAEPVAGLLDDLAACRAALAGEEPPAAAPGPGAAAAGHPPGPAPGHPPGLAPGTGSGPAPGRTLRVPAEKIDHLLDVAGEIMQDRTRLAHSLGGLAGQSGDVADAFGAGERMLDDLKDTAVGMRTLPLAVIAGPLPRMVRDFARGAGKDVEFVVSGADTELDRVILESLSEPLGHLLRNAVIHGIESPAERECAGKPARGRVELRAASRGSLVEIVVADDGRGASTEAIGEARREGSLADVLARPGYSTAEEVTDLAGRGVGLDAVQTYAHSVGGSLTVRSEPGQGMEVVQLLPVALALMEVLLFERAGAVYGVPLAAVEQVVMVAETLTLEGRQALEIGGKSLPVADFAGLIGASAPPLGGRPPALIISVGGRRAVVTCDTLLGEEEVVIKPLGPLLAGPEGYLGASILGDGRIALLIEPAMLTRRSPRVPALVRPGAADGQGAPSRILVVEDSFTVRELQRSILEAAGYSVATARDGRDALAVLDRDAAISLVITDLEMPGLDGIGLTRAIRADPARSSLPVVIVTSRAADEDRLSGIEAGADAYMAKRSFDQQALLATVERLVGR